MNEEGNYWDPLVLPADMTVTVLLEGTVPVPAFILLASATTIESEAFTGLVDQFFRLPDTVTFIAGDAFDPATKVLVPKDSFAETRCRELGLKVFTFE